LKSAYGFSCGSFGSCVLVVEDEGFEEVGILCVVPTPRFAMKKRKLEKSDNRLIEKVIDCDEQQMI
jgi:hypothetical protein